MSDKIEIWKDEDTKLNHPLGSRGLARVKHITGGSESFYDKVHEEINDIAFAHGWKIVRVGRPKEEGKE